MPIKEKLKAWMMLRKYPISKKDYEMVFKIDMGIFLFF
ncbi:hypothetical protein SCHIN_v1c03120 [Spiroplasma chinense]|uniref:Uncharacterized protein n=1 Tax=Spiroplasma chinense TaxID=216932 RepID=A0A5B9Y4A3_9MOLU|nr:hypothetical protein SCHIN_v1c03120 [Spiroplasma chinense]